MRWAQKIGVDIEELHNPAPDAAEAPATKPLNKKAPKQKAKNVEKKAE